MSFEFDDIANEWIPPPKCSLCGGYGYRFPKGSHSAVKCESCHGDKISRKPRH